MALYYKGNHVDRIVREYTYGNTLMAEIVVNGETFYVPYKELDENQGSQTPVLSQSRVEQPTQDSETTAERENEVSEIKEAAEKALEESFEALENATTEVEQSNEPAVTYVAKNGTKTLTFQDVTDKNVRRYKFDLNAIKDVVDGKQKTHKGFTFEVK